MNANTATYAALVCVGGTIALMMLLMVVFMMKSISMLVSDEVNIIKKEIKNYTSSKTTLFKTLLFEINLNLFPGKPV